MRSPFVGLLMQHGHVSDLDFVKRLTDTSQPQLHATDAAKQLLAPETTAKRSAWRAAVGASRYLFLINSP